MESSVTGPAAAYKWRAAPLAQPQTLYPLGDLSVAPSGDAGSSLRVAPHTVAADARITLAVTGPGGAVAQA